MQKEQTIFITGASSGIGREIAIRLAKAGHKVFAGIRRKIDKEEIETLNKNIKGVYIDITNSASIDKAFWYVMHQVNKIDVLINNAGIVVAGPMELLSVSKLKEQFDVNTFGSVALVQKFMPLLTNAKIINISSMAATGIFPYVAPYCASKRSLDILFNSFYIENKSNIKVISVKPAAIKTPIWNKSVKNAQNFMMGINKSAKAKYQKDLDFMQENALKNNSKGIRISAVVNTVETIVNSKNPKASYNVGIGAVIAQILSMLPIDILNKFIKYYLNK